MTDGKPATTRAYVGRFGQPISDPATIEARRVLTQLRRLGTIHQKAGRQWPYVTVGELADATKLTDEQIVAWVQEHEAWLLGMTDGDGTVAGRGVYQDGE